MNIADNIFYAGVSDRSTDLFEGQYRVPDGMTYNSYIISDEKIAVMDTVDIRFGDEWLAKIGVALGEHKPDYLIIHHMEPDHSANIMRFMALYPDTEIVATEAAFKMMRQFFGSDFSEKRITVKDGDTLSLGSKTLTFVTAPMVHWPEVMMSYETSGKILFSADAFGKFGSADADEDWICEARRYYFGIVGKYGKQVLSLLEKVQGMKIDMICPLHGPVLDKNIGYYVNLYRTWASYEPESDGVVIAYTSVYGNTEKAVKLLGEKLSDNGCPKVVMHDLARCDMSEAVEDAFRYGKLVLATTTYNSDIFPFMREFIFHLTERGFRNRTVAFIENGSWAPRAAKVMREMLSDSENIVFSDNTVRIVSALKEDNLNQIDNLTKELCHEYAVRLESEKVRTDVTALENIGYGLYVVTSSDGEKDNGLIVNTVSQVTSTPNRIAVTVNKSNYSHSTIKVTGVMNVNCLTTETPFSVIERFGFHSGKESAKFSDFEIGRSENGLPVLTKYINAFLSLKVCSEVDLGTHTMFICDVTEAHTVSGKESLTYSYYHKNIKPKVKADGKKGYVCTVCGYIYEGENLPDDFICPLCKHGTEAFKQI